MIWKETTEIGLGIAKAGTKSVVVANYYPKGNVYNAPAEGGDDKWRYFRLNVLPRPSIPDAISLI